MSQYCAACLRARMTEKRDLSRDKVVIGSVCDDCGAIHDWVEVPPVSYPPFTPEALRKRGPTRKRGWRRPTGMESMGASIGKQSL